MRTQRREWLMLMILAGGLFVALWWCARVLDRHRQSALAATADLQVCRDLAADIRRLQERPTLADDRANPMEQLTGRIQTAVEQAGVTLDQIIRIHHQPPRRVRDTAYEERPTEVMLRRLTLRQAVGFLCGMTEQDPSLRVKAIRLTPPRDREDTEHWTLDATLAYLVYAPVGEGGPRP